MILDNPLDDSSAFIFELPVNKSSMYHLLVVPLCIHPAFWKSLIAKECMTPSHEIKKLIRTRWTNRYFFSLRSNGAEGPGISI
jgi:hypothetical protein